MLEAPQDGNTYGRRNKSWIIVDDPFEVGEIRRFIPSQPFSQNKYLPADGSLISPFDYPDMANTAGAFWSYFWRLPGYNSSAAGDCLFVLNGSMFATDDNGNRSSLRAKDGGSWSFGIDGAEKTFVTKLSNGVSVLIMSGTEARLITSTDGGQTFSAPESASTGVVAYITLGDTPCMVLKGTVSNAYVRTAVVIDGTRINFHLIGGVPAISVGGDTIANGKYANFSGVAIKAQGAEFDVPESSHVVKVGNRILANGGRVYSDDGGETWQTRPTGAGGIMAVLGSRVLSFYQYTSDAPPSIPYISDNGGDSWTEYAPLPFPVSTCVATDQGFYARQAGWVVNSAQAVYQSMNFLPNIPDHYVKVLK